MSKHAWDIGINQGIAFLWLFSAWSAYTHGSVFLMLLVLLNAALYTWRAWAAWRRYREARLLLAYALDLDRLVANFGITRKPGETDEELRARATAFMVGFSSLERLTPELARQLDDEMLVQLRPLHVSEEQWREAVAEKRRGITRP